MRTPTFALSLSLILALAPAALGCAARTTIEHVWRAPTWDGSFAHVAVFGLTKRPGLRREFETRMAAAFANVGVRATPSYLLFPGDGELDDGTIAETLRERGIDGVLATRLIGVDSQQRYVHTSPWLVAGGPPIGFYGFYHGAYAWMYSPGYMVDYDIVVVETNLYDVDLQSSELVWSGLSETFDPQSIDEAIESYAEAMVTTLVESDYLTRTITPGAIEAHTYE